MQIVIPAMSAFEELAIVDFISVPCVPWSATLPGGYRFKRGGRRHNKN
jgi:hypothetical protein